MGSKLRCFWLMQGLAIKAIHYFGSFSISGNTCAKVQNLGMDLRLNFARTYAVHFVNHILSVYLPSVQRVTLCYRAHFRACISFQVSFEEFIIPPLIQKISVMAHLQKPYIGYNVDHVCDDSC